MNVELGPEMEYCRSLCPGRLNPPSTIAQAGPKCQRCLETGTEQSLGRTACPLGELPLPYLAASLYPASLPHIVNGMDK